MAIETAPCGTFRQLCGCILLAQTLHAQEPDPGFLDRWALTIPGGGAGWLEVTARDGYYDASILWGGGSVVPLDSVFFTDGDTLVATRINEVKRRDAAGKVVRTQRFTDAIMAKLDGDSLQLTLMQPDPGGFGVKRETFAGERIPPLPPAPDLARTTFAEPIILFNGGNLDQWELLNPDDANGWGVADGVLTNNPTQEKGKPHRNYGNLRTKATFEDFNLTLEVMVPEGGNSGIYLRGIYEIQVAATHGRPLDSHNMGGIYSRVAPALQADKPAGEWQTYDITLVDRHVTVVLNGRMIHDNVPLMGCTGGAITSDESRPGPLYLQGDHTVASYRNIVLRPVKK